MIVALYLAAIVVANLLASTFGPSVTVFTAFLFIGLDLTCRDRLHDEWGGRGLAPKMAALIGAGAIISFGLNRDAGPIALASTLAFGLAATADAIVYHTLRGRSWFARVNGSNVVGATVDSIVFPTVAFGALLPWVVAGQLLAKVFGGFVWSLVLNTWRREEVAA